MGALSLLLQGLEEEESHYHSASAILTKGGWRAGELIVQGGGRPKRV